MTKLNQLGWCDFFASQPLADNEQGLSYVRVVEEQRNLYRVTDGETELWAELSGRVSHAADTRADLPAVGDWVLAAIRPAEKRASIVRVLERRTKFSRKAAGSSELEQVIAANVDIAFIVTSLNDDFNLRRIERYLTVVGQSGAKPVVLLTKADLCPSVEVAEASIREVNALCPGVPVHALSALTDVGLEPLAAYIGDGVTTVLIGSSGVGKSTIVNHLLGEARQLVNAARASDDKGRHTTTFRRLLILPKLGGMIIDTPGMRELHVWEGEEGLTATFGDIEELQAKCRYGDCKHKTEPHCAVKAALESGVLAADRYESYLKLERESAFQAHKREKTAQAAEKKKGRKPHPNDSNYKKRNRDD